MSGEGSFTATSLLNAMQLEYLQHRHNSVVLGRRIRRNDAMVPTDNLYVTLIGETSLYTFV